MKAGSGYFVFEKDSTDAVYYQFVACLGTRSELRKHLNARLKGGLDVKNLFIIYGTEKKVTGVKVVAEFETAGN